MKCIAFILHRQGFLALVAMPLVLLVGCAQIPLGSPSPSIENIGKARASRTAPVAVGVFRVDPKASPDIDKGLNVRSNTVSSPIEGSFAQYLKQTVVTDLRASGLYDSTSQTILSGFLTESMLDVPSDTGQASLGAHFVLTRTGKTIYEKDLKARTTWPSSFVGAVAIPEGINRYTGLYHALVGELLDDPDYQSANAK
jgi:hypothetical protein